MYFASKFFCFGGVNMCLYTANVARVAGNRLTNFLLRADVAVKFNFWLVKIIYVLYYSSTLYGKC